MYFISFAPESDFSYIHSNYKAQKMNGISVGMIWWKTI
jgi:hypothetical protein